MKNFVELILIAATLLIGHEIISKADVRYLVIGIGFMWVMIIAALWFKDFKNK